MKNTKMLNTYNKRSEHRKRTANASQMRLLLALRIPQEEVGFDFGHRQRLAFASARQVGLGTKSRPLKSLHWSDFAAMRPRLRISPNLRQQKGTLLGAIFVGGRGGIRTHVPLRTTAFRVRLVATTSILFQLSCASLISQRPSCRRLESIPQAIEKCNIPGPWQQCRLARRLHK